jgi:hypothetical protein
MAHLTVPGATFGPIHQERWGRIATMDNARRCATADLSALAAESDPARLSTCRSLRLARLGGPQGDELSFSNLKRLIEARPDATLASTAVSRIDEQIADASQHT